MNLSKVSSSNIVITNFKPNSLVNELQQQKMELTKQIANINAGKDDAKTKSEKIKNIRDQIAELDKQIMQAQIDEKQKELEEMQQKNAEKRQMEQYEDEDDGKKGGIILSESLNQLLVANSAHSEYKNMNATRVKMVGEVRVAQGQAKNSHGGSIKHQMGVISEIGSRISDLADKMAKKIENIDKKLESARKIGEQEAEKSSNNKVDGTDENQEKKSVKAPADGELETGNTSISSKDSDYPKFAQENDGVTTVKGMKESNSIDIVI
jgi:hypothetical protein